MDCVSYNEDNFTLKRGSLLLRFFSIHFFVILAELKKIIRYTKEFVKKRLVKSRFHCNEYFLYCTGS